MVAMILTCPSISLSQLTEIRIKITKTREEMAMIVAMSLRMLGPELLSRAPRVINASAWNAIASIVIAVATIFYTIYAHRQWKAMSGQIEVMRDANSGSDSALKQTVGKMQAQIQSAKDANKIAMDSLIGVQRAFVFPALVTSAGETPAGQKPNFITLQVKWENSGSTPTKGMTTHYSYEPSISSPKDLYIDKWDGRPHKQTSGYVAPKGFSYSEPINLAFPLVESWAHSRTRVYMWGWIRYRDVFPNTPIHVTRYCWYVNLSVIPGPNNTSNFISDAHNCEKGNCADEECAVQ